MTEIEALKGEIRKLSAKATTAKLNLHDLSEDLPLNWRSIPEIAQAAHEAFAALDVARARLKALETA